MYLLKKEVGSKMVGITERGIKKRKEKLVEVLSELQGLSNLSAEELLTGGKENPISQQFGRIGGKYQTVLLNLKASGTDTKEYEELYECLMRRIEEKGKRYIKRERGEYTPKAIRRRNSKIRREGIRYSVPLVSLSDADTSEPSETV